MAYVLRFLCLLLLVLIALLFCYAIPFYACFHPGSPEGGPSGSSSPSAIANLRSPSVRQSIGSIVAMLPCTYQKKERNGLHRAVGRGAKLHFSLSSFFIKGMRETFHTKLGVKGGPNWTSS